MTVAVVNIALRTRQFLRRSRVSKNLRCCLSPGNRCQSTGQQAARTSQGYITYAIRPHERRRACEDSYCRPSPTSRNSGQQHQHRLDSEQSFREAWVAALLKKQNNSARPGRQYPSIRSRIRSAGLARAGPHGAPSCSGRAENLWHPGCGRIPRPHPLRVDNPSLWQALPGCLGNERACPLESM